ncbi:MAG: hypothetical protein FWC69_00905 [Defluviitaleaceae bacterium]|nr:hypothetical protein [Defluviitaleaceae bacterium]
MKKDFEDFVELLGEDHNMVDIMRDVAIKTVEILREGLEEDDDIPEEAREAYLMQVVAQSTTMIMLNRYHDWLHRDEY